MGISTKIKPANFKKLFYLIVSFFFMLGILVYIFNFNQYVIETGSMEPLINRSDLVIVRKTNDISEMEEGDIIAFREDIFQNNTTEVVVHFIYSISEGSEGIEISTISNISSTPDPWVLTDKDIIGIHVYTVGEIGRFVYFVSSPIGILILVINFSAFLFVLKQILRD